MFKMSGTLPECLFSLPNINTLHVSGNGLAGRIPGHLSAWPAALSDLTLSHNQLTGPIPNALQRQVGQFVNFDLSFNKLNGLLEDVILSNSTKISLNVNRFSGFLSSSVVKAPPGQVSVLEGSLIDCDNRKTQLPPNDPYIERFKCGSDTFNNFLIAFAVLLVSSIGLLLRRFGASFGVVIAYINPSISTMEASVQHILLSLRHVRVYCVLLLVVIVFAMVPTYCALSSAVGNHTYLYAWAASAAFKSGVASAAVLLIFWTSFLFGNFWLFLASQRSLYSSCELLHSIGGDDKIPSADNRGPEVRVPIKIKSWAVVSSVLMLRLVLIFTLNAFAMLTPNIGYVIVVSLYNSSAKAAASVLLTIYKRVWSIKIVELLLKHRSLYFGVSEDDIDAHGVGALKGGLMFNLLLSAFSSVIAPSISLMVPDSNCFVAVMYAPAAIASSYQAEVCKTELNYQSSTLGNITTTTSFEVKVCNSVTQHESYQPAFQYNYQCSSTLLQTYSSVFLLMALYSAFGEPLLQFVCRACVSRFPSCSWMLLRFIPRIMHTRQERGEGDERRLKKQRPIFFSARGFRIIDQQTVFRAMMQDVMLLLTFGTVAPLLGITFLASLMSRSLQWHHLIVELAGNEEEIAGGGVADLTADCRESSTRDTNLHSIDLFVVVFASLFLSNFLLDAAGDKVGWKKSLWAPILMWFLPVCLGQLYEAATRKRTDQPIDLMEVEMGSIKARASQDPNQWPTNPIHAAPRRSSSSSITVDSSTSERRSIASVPGRISSSITSPRLDRDSGRSSLDTLTDLQATERPSASTETHPTRPFPSRVRSARL